MADRLDELDYYSLLKVSSDASPDEIRAAFHRFALKYHPDNHSGGDPERHRRAADVYRRGAEAYRVLRDQGARQRYDALLAQGEKRLRGDDEKKAEQRAGAGVASLNIRARPFWAKARLAAKQGDFQNAKLNLGIALQHHPDHPGLQDALERVKAAHEQAKAAKK